jgi:hypothetical protein
MVARKMILTTILFIALAGTVLFPLAACSPKEILWSPGICFAAKFSCEGR